MSSNTIPQKLPKADFTHEQSLYLKLMIKTLSASLYPQSSWKRFHIDDRKWYQSKNPSKLLRYSLKSLAYKLLQRYNLEVYHSRPYSPDLRREGRDWPEFLGYTMIGEKRLSNIVDAVNYILKHNIKGDLMEAGVWRGGASIMMKAMLSMYRSSKSIYLADSFAGMPESDHPLDTIDISNVEILAVPQETVLNNFKSFDLLDDQIYLIPGYFSDSLPNAKVPRLSLLRLDADMYESTMTCLLHLYDNVSSGGVVIIDDYFSWQPCRDAVTKYLLDNQIEAKINRIDGDGAYFIKS